MSNNPNDKYSTPLGMDEPLSPFDAQAASGRRAMFLLVLAVVIMAVLALIIFKVYQPGVRDREAPPTISADTTPFKVKPENPGGTVTPNQDKAVFDVMSGHTETGEVQAAPDVEMPVDLPKSANIISDKTPEKTQTQPVEPSSTPQNLPRSLSTVKTPPSAGTSSSVVSSDYVVQVASVRSEAAARDIWAKLSRDNAGLITSSMSADIRRADLGDKGIYYRLRVAGLSDKAAATRLCDQLKSRNQACFVAKK